MKAIKITLGTLVCVMAGMGLLVLLINHVNWNKHLDFVARTTERFTDWQVETLEGLAIHIGSELRLSVKGIKLKGRNTAALQSLTAEKASLEFRLLPLLQKRVIINSIELQGGKVVIRRSQQELKANDAGRSSSGELSDWPAFFVRQASIRNFDLIVQPASAGAELNLHIASLNLGSENRQSPVEITSKGHLDEQPYQLAGTLGSFQQFQTEGALFPLQLDLLMAQQELHLKGTITVGQPNFDLEASGRGADYTLFSSYLGPRFDLQRAPPYSWSFELTRQSQKLDLTQLEIKLGQSVLQGDASFTRSSGRPFIQGRLTTSILRHEDFAAFIPSPAPHEDAGVHESEDPAPWAKFEALFPSEIFKNYDALIHLSVAGYRGPDHRLQFQKLSADMVLQKGRLVIDPLQLSVGKGNLRASLMADTHEKNIQLQIERDGPAFNFISALQAFMVRDEPLPIRYLSAQQLAFDLKWLNEPEDQAIRVNLKIIGGRVHYEAGDLQKKARTPVEPGLQDQLARYPSLLIESVLIQNLTWLSLTKGDALGAHIDSLRLTAEGADQPLRLNSYGTIQGLRYRVFGQMGSYNDLKDSRRSFSLDLKGSLAEQELSVNGTIRLARQTFKLNVSGSGTNLGAMDSVLPISLGSLPPYHFQLSLVHEPGLYNIENIGLEMGRSQLHGELVLTTDQSKPYLEGHLTSPLLRYQDIAGLWSANSPTPVKGPDQLVDNGPALPDKPLPFDLLQKLDADLQLQVNRYQGQTASRFVNQAEARVSLRQGRLEVAPFNLASSMGRAGGKLVVNAQKSPALVSLDLGFELLSLGNLARELSLAFPALNLSAKELVLGKLSGTLDVKSKGSSLRRLTENADGNLLFVIDEGYLAATVLEGLGMDLTEILASYVVDHPPTKINCFYAAFSMNNGVIHTNQFFISTHDSNVRGEGYLDLNRRFIDYRFESYAKDFSIGNVGSPIFLKGPFSSVQVRVARKELIVRSVAAIALGVVINPLAAMLPFVEPGTEKKGQCSRYADRIVFIQHKVDEHISVR